MLFGESLGTGVAVALAATQRVGGLILEAPFTSAVDVGARAYWFLPVRLLMKDPFRSDTRIGKVTVPLLMLHGARDGVVPIALGERLFSLANEPKQFVRFPAGTHVDLDQYGALDAVRSFIAGYPALNSLNTLAPPMPFTKLVGGALSAGCGHVGAHRRGIRRNQVITPSPVGHAHYRVGERCSR